MVPHRDGAHDRDLVAVEDHPLDVIHQKLTLRVEIGTCLQAGFRGCAELPDARVHKVLVLGGSQRRDELGLRPRKPFQLFVESAVGGYVLVARHLIRSIPVDDQLPPLFVEGADLPRDAVRAPAQCSGRPVPAPLSMQPRSFPGSSMVSRIISKTLPSRIWVAISELRQRSICVRSCVVLSGAAIAAVHGVMIDGHLPGGAHDLLPTSRRTSTRFRNAALNEAAQKVVRDGLAISLRRAAAAALAPCRTAPARRWRAP